VTEEQLKEYFQNFDYVVSEIDASGQKVHIKRKPAIASIKMGQMKEKSAKFAYILYDTVGASQKAIQIYDGNNPFAGDVPLRVEVWQSKDEHEREKKRKEFHQTHELIKAICQQNNPVQNYPPRTQHPRNAGGQGQNQDGGRGHRQGRSGNRGGGYGNRSGRPAYGNVGQRLQPAQAPPQQVFQGLLPLPLLNIDDLKSLTDPEERKQFVGNHIYPIIDNAFSGALAGRITGMLLDESVIDFTKLLTDQKYITDKSFEANQLLLNSLNQVPPQGQVDQQVSQ
jgi:RNA recognition motif-containing protein